MVLNVRDRNVNGVSSENGDRVGLEERGHLGDLEVGVEGVAQESVTGVRAGAGLNGGLGNGEEREGGEEEQKGEAKPRH